MNQPKITHLNGATYDSIHELLQVTKPQCREIIIGKNAPKNNPELRIKGYWQTHFKQRIDEVIDVVKCEYLYYNVVTSRTYTRPYIVKHEETH